MSQIEFKINHEINLSQILFIGLIIVCIFDILNIIKNNSINILNIIDKYHNKIIDFINNEKKINYNFKNNTNNDYDDDDDNNDDNNKNNDKEYNYEEDYNENVEKKDEEYDEEEYNYENENEDYDEDDENDDDEDDENDDDEDDENDENDEDDEDDEDNEDNEDKDKKYEYEDEEYEEDKEYEEDEEYEYNEKVIYEDQNNNNNKISYYDNFNSIKLNNICNFIKKCSEDDIIKIINLCSKRILIPKFYTKDELNEITIYKVPNNIWKKLLKTKFDNEIDNIIYNSIDE